MTLFSASSLPIATVQPQLQIKIKLMPEVSGPPPLALPARQRITEQQAAARSRRHVRSAPYHSGKRW